MPDPVIPPIRIETDPAKIEQIKAEIRLGVKIYKQKIEAEKCVESLRLFTKCAWQIIGMGTPYQHGWHIDAICDHLEAMSRRDIRRLIINVPPRSGKSSIISIAFTAWRWLKCPTEKFLSASYATQLSLRDSRYTRNLIKSDWYQKRWGNLFAITKDQNEKGRFENDKGGYRIATSKDASTTGEGGSFRIYDDPNNLKTINSKPERESENEYHRIMSTRFVDPQSDVELCVQQRGHPDDFTGMLKDLGWELLCIPNEYEGHKYVTSIGWEDPRKNIGELMHPERIGPLETEDLKKTLGPDYAGQYQQRPAALAGNLLKREWWKFWNPRLDGMPAEQMSLAEAPIRLKVGANTIEQFAKQIPDAFEQICQSWDMAMKDLETSDNVAGHAWGRIGANAYLLSRDTGKKDFPATLQAVRRMSREFPCPEKLVEDKANGPAVIQTLKNEIPGLIAVNDGGGKIARARAISGYVEAGNCWLPNPNLYPWVWDLLDEFSDFPSVSHDDDTDAMTQATKRLFDSMANIGLPEFRVQPRMGEPETACHIDEESAMNRSLAAHWRRWIAVSPGHPGAAIWFAETPSGALRAYRELELEGADAAEAGRRIAEASIPDVLAWMGSIRQVRMWHIDLLMEKLAFAPVEPVGSYAALLEQGLLEYKSEHGEFDDRQRTEQAIKAAKFSTQMALMEDSAMDHLRQLLQFQPPDFEECEFDRKKAFALAREDMKKFAEYMASCSGEPFGEWPKLKISSQCKHVIASLGCCRREEAMESEDPFFRALLIGVSAPPSLMSKRPVVELPYRAKSKTSPLQNRRFEFGRR